MPMPEGQKNQQYFHCLCCEGCQASAAADNAAPSATASAPVRHALPDVVVVVLPEKPVGALAVAVRGQNHAPVTHVPSLQTLAQHPRAGCPTGGRIRDAPLLLSVLAIVGVVAG